MIGLVKNVSRLHNSPGPLETLLLLLATAASPGCLSRSSLEGHDSAVLVTGGWESSDTAGLAGQDTEHPPDTTDSASPADDLVRCSVDVGTTLGTIDSLNGVHGSPAPLNSGYPNLVSLYQEAEIPFVRLPVGDGHDYSLSGVFPRSAASPDDKYAYDFSNIDRQVDLTVASGAQVLWEATYDIGTTDTWFDYCFHQGFAPADLNKWAEVIKRVLAHFNDGWNDGHALGVQYVESLNEPFKARLYDSSEYLQAWQAYEALASAVSAYNEQYGRDIKVVGFANPMDLALGDESTYLSDVWLMDSFLSYVKENEVPLDVFSYHLYGTHQEQYDTALVVREHLDQAGFEDVPIWNTEWNTRVIEVDDKPLASAFFAAHNAQTKTLWQGLVDQAFVFRASQRPLGDSEHGIDLEDCDDTFYISAEGVAQPAYYQWLMFRDMARNTPDRLPANPVEEDKLTFLAGASQSRDRLGLLISYWEELLVNGIQRSYAVRLTGLPPGSRWIAEQRIVDPETDAYYPVVTTGIVASDSGELLVGAEMEPWNVHYWDIQADSGTR